MEVEILSFVFLNTEDMQKTADGHEAIMSAAIKATDKLGKQTKFAPALGVDQFLDYSGAIRCICHSMTLVVNESATECGFLATLSKKINDIYDYLEDRPKVSTAIVAEQCRTYSRDRTVRLQRVGKTRWHSKLAVMEKYNTLKPIFEKVFPEDAPELLSRSDEELIGECILVMQEIR